MKVLVVGAGGLGCPAALGLAAPATTLLTLADFDVVDATNLHRQPWHHPADIGRPKVDSAADKLRGLFPDLKVVGLRTKVDAGNVDALLALHDVVVDGTDGADVKFLLNDAAVRAGKVLVYGGVLRFTGQAMRIAPGSACLRCLFEGPPADAPTCAQAGVMGTMAGVIGGLQAELALGGPAGVLHVVDGLTLKQRTVAVTPSRDCVHAHSQRA